MNGHVLVRHVPISNNNAYPKAVALVLGHLGSTAQSTMDQFGEKLYLSRNCTTITASSPFVRFFMTQHRFLRPTAASIIRETAAVLRDTPNTPLAVHLFSNGGAFLLEEMELLMAEAEDRSRNDEQLPTSSVTGGVSWSDAEIIQERLEYQFFDSCPCYLHQMWDISPYWNDAFPSPAWRSNTLRKLYFLGSAMSLTLWCTMTGSFGRSSQFWSRMRTSPYCRKHQIYFYTTADMMTDASRIDDLISSRRQEYGTDIVAQRYDDSGHCALYRDHPEDYNRVLDESLAAAINRRRRQEEPLGR